MATGTYYKSYTKKPSNAAQYTLMRGVTDFTNAAQLNMFEKGHGMLVIINRPEFLNKLSAADENVKNLVDNFCNILEYEFKGLDGIEDISAEELVYSDGIAEIHGVGKVTEQSASEISMTFTEKSGSVITKFVRYYLDGVRDSRTQVKHYHGLIADGSLALGFENEVFNLLYLVTDASGLGLEAAYLLANAWPTSAKTSIYNMEKGNIETAEVEVTFKCFVLRNNEIDQRALKMLAYINKDASVANATSKSKEIGAATQDALGAVADMRGGAHAIHNGEDVSTTINWDSQSLDAYKGYKPIENYYSK